MKHSSMIRVQLKIGEKKISFVRIDNFDRTAHRQAIEKLGEKSERRKR